MKWRMTYNKKVGFWSAEYNFITQAAREAARESLHRLNNFLPSSPSYLSSDILV